MSQTAHPDLDPWHGLLYAVIERLTPLFKSDERGSTYARYAAGEAIASFRPELRADYASIGRILALSLASITAAAHSTNPDLPEAEQHRFLSKASSLSRTADQAERVMMARQKLGRENGIPADTLIPRPPDRPARYRPLPPDDPASGASLAARAAKEGKTADHANFAPRGAQILTPGQSNSASQAARVAQNDPAATTPQSPQTGQTNPAHRPAAPESPQIGKDRQTNSAPAQAKTGAIDEANSAQPNFGPEEQPKRLLEFAKAMRQAIASGKPPPDLDAFLTQVAVPGLAPDRTIPRPPAIPRPERPRDPFTEALIRGRPEPETDS